MLSDVDLLVKVLQPQRSVSINQSIIKMFHVSIVSGDPEIGRKDFAN